MDVTRGGPAADQLALSSAIHTGRERERDREGDSESAGRPTQLGLLAEHFAPTPFVAVKLHSSAKSGTVLYTNRFLCVHQMSNYLKTTSNCLYPINIYI